MAGILASMTRIEANTRTSASTWWPGSSSTTTELRTRCSCWRGQEDEKIEFWSQWYIQDQVEEGHGGEKEAGQGKGKGDGQIEGSGRSTLHNHYILFYILQFYVRKIKSGDSEESPGWSMRRNLKMTPSPLEMRTWSEPSGSYFTHLATTKIWGTLMTMGVWAEWISTRQKICFVKN